MVERESLIEKVTFEQRLEGDEEAGHVAKWGARRRETFRSN